MGANVVSINEEESEINSKLLNARATSVFVSGNDVYVTGYVLYDNNDKIAKLWEEQVAKNNVLREDLQAWSNFYLDNCEIVAKLWKNGVSQNLSDGNKQNFPISVFVSGDDVYVAGYENTDHPFHEVLPTLFSSRVAKLWKNGIVQNLCGDETKFTMASSVFVSDKDVYVAGEEIIKTNEQERYSLSRVARLWKNGEIQSLSNDKGFARSVFVSGENVYLAGAEIYKSLPITGKTYYRATLWKNGIAQNLTDNTKNAEALSVYVSGKDVYVAGSEYSDVDSDKRIPVLWKNGIVQKLPMDNIVSQQYDNVEGIANSVYISDDDNVCVAGFIKYEKGTFAVLWKNGLAQKLDDDGQFQWLVGIGGMEPYNTVFVNRGDVYVAGNKEKVAVYWKNNVLNTLTEKPKNDFFFVR